MESLKHLLVQADDGYLEGLSNRGTVKRAYKDLEQEQPEVVWDEETGEVQAAFGDTVCHIRTPLGESTCSCPSRSVCRHIVAAILYLRQGLIAEEAAGEAQPSQASAGETSAAAPAGETSAAASSAAAPVAEAPAAEAPAVGTVPSELRQALLAVPLSRIKNACGDKAGREFAARIEAGERPAMEMGSTVTVTFPWDGRTVHLLYPMEYSACSCHSREFCAHKALAVLAFQLEDKAVSIQAFKSQIEKSEEWDQAAVSQAVCSLKEGIVLQLSTGLSRLSPEAAESMERLAVISHGAGLAAFEAGCRRAASQYRQYFSRAAAFREEELLEELLSLYRRAECLAKEEDAKGRRALAGSFRDVYYPVQALHLTAIGSRSFKSKAGYEGEKYYFLETEQKKWYAWIDARPTFYEGVRRRPAGRGGREQAPWGLSCSRERMMELELVLTGAKAAADGRISVSKDTKGEVIGTRRLSRPEVQAMIFQDYRRLLDWLREFRQEEGGGEPLALVEADIVSQGHFDTVRQRFSMELFDREGKRLLAVVRYSQEEKLTIQVLERLASRLEKQGKKRVVFFGIPYLEEGQLCLYPIEYFDSMEPADRQEAEADRPGKAAALENTPPAEAVKETADLLGEVRRALADLFQSGLSSAPEETAKRFSRLGEACGDLGLHGAEDALGRMAGLLEEKRHRFKMDRGPVILLWAALAAYVRKGLKETDFDLAAAGMEEKKKGDRYEFK